MADTTTGSEPTDREKKIIRQIEYYFGNANLRRDRFMQLEIREDDGWISLETMVKFNRLAQLSKDPEIIVTALEKSTSGIIEINEDKKKIRRSPDKPLPEENASNLLEVKARTVYCKGFPLDAKIDVVQSFMDKFGEAESIFMRRDKEKKFKGSIFVTYKTKAEADKFMKPESVKFEETEMVRYLKSDYYKMKSEERKNLKEKNKKDRRVQQEQKEKEVIEATTDYKEFEKGLILYFTGATDQTSREDLKEVFGDYGTISWVDFDRGKTEGAIRFEEGSNAKDIIDRVLGDHNNKLEIRGNALTMRVLEGEEEEQHWKEVFENRARGRFKKQQGRRKKKGDRRPNKRTRFEGKKTTFNESDGEGGDDGGKDGGKDDSKDGDKEDGGEDGDKAAAVEVKKEDSGEKRPREEGTDTKEPSPKQAKTE